MPRFEEARSRAATAATARRKPSRSEPGVEAMVARVFSARALLPGFLEFAGSVEMECPPSLLDVAAGAGRNARYGEP